MFEDIEPFVITSSRKDPGTGRWIWTRGSAKAAHGLAETIWRQWMDAGRYDVTVTVLDVAEGTSRRYEDTRLTPEHCQLLQNFYMKYGTLPAEYPMPPGTPRRYEVTADLASAYTKLSRRAP